MKELLRQFPFFVFLYRNVILLKTQYGLNIFAVAYRMTGFIYEYIKLKKIEQNPNFSIEIKNWYPCLTDKTKTTPLDPVYFYQDAWAARKIFENKPTHHYDVGSSAKTIAIISQFVTTTMVDIRPVELQLDGLSFVQGSILSLPFEDNSIESISSLCVVEHIGLGRYGDTLDQFGSEKAIRELIRVAKSGGRILFSVPVERKNKVYFNGYRSFTKDYIFQLFDKCVIEDEQYIYDRILQREFDPNNDAGIGLYLFRKK
jgi:SAM-dependent methyltransferase